MRLTVSFQVDPITRARAIEIRTAIMQLLQGDTLLSAPQFKLEREEENL